MAPNHTPNSEKLHLMGRRRFVKTLAGLGVSTAALPYLSQDAVAGMQDQKDVVRVSGLINSDTLPEEVSNLGPTIDWSASTPDPSSAYLQNPDTEALGGRTPILKPTPYPKWKAVEAARDARRNLAAKIPESWTSNRDYLTIRVAVEVDGTVKNPVDPARRYLVPIYPVITRANGEVEKPNISFEEFSSYFPSNINGVAGRGTALEATVTDIPVRPERREEELQAYYDNYYRPVPAGCVFGTGADNSATLGMPATNDSDGGAVFLTAAHIFKDIIGWSREAHQPVWINSSDQYKIGETDGNRRVNQSDFDAVVVHNLTANTTRNFAANNGDNTYQDTYPINGIITNSELYYYAGDESYEITKQGVSTGRRSGFISGFDGNILGIRAYAESGDSGGPYFREYYEPEFAYEYSLAAGVHKGASGSTANATAIETIENQFNVTVGT